MKAYEIGDLVSVDLDSMCLPPFGTLGLVIDAKENPEYMEQPYYTIKFNDTECYLVRHNDLVKV